MASDACIQEAGWKDFSFLGNGSVDESCRHGVAVLESHGLYARRSARHSHSAAKVQVRTHAKTVAVFMTDDKGRFTYPDGKSQDFNGKAGDVNFDTAKVHLPENTGDKAFDVVVVELKGKPFAK